MGLFFRTVKITGGLALALAAVFLLVRCGGDDGDGKKGDTRKILEIHMLENVTPRPFPHAGQAAAAARQLVAVNGLYYRGAMGSAVLDNPLQFIVRDSLSAPIQGATVTFARIEGDGALTSSTGTTDATGAVATGYTFNGDLGHAVIRVTSSEADTLLVYVRANTLIPGATGQAQYVLFEDTVGRVINFNGPAEGDAPDPGQYLQYLEYLTDDHIVVLVLDSNQNSASQVYEPVVGVILTTGYTQKTAEGIGLGSTYDQMIAAYGQPDSVGFDGTPPPTSIYFYKSLGLNIYTEPPATTAALSPLGPGDRSRSLGSAAPGYHRAVLQTAKVPAVKD